jgi:signal transduction histidine kinase
MRLTDYLKERWITLLFLFFAFLFAAMVYRLDYGFSIRESNAQYILMGWGLLFLAYLIVDYYTFCSRWRKFRDYCSLNFAEEPEDAFFYPSDRKQAKLIRELADEYETYKSNIRTEWVQEMDFITKWLHDVKVPIAAARLILESQEEDLPVTFYRNLYSELFNIEESVLRVFYELKTSRFFDDYKIVKTGTRKLISQGLKGYSSFFSYKKLRIAVEGDDYQVLTDEKWCSYILSQIISNAVKYSSVGGSIEITVKREAAKTIISIKNTGRGISQEDIERIFRKGFTSSEGRIGANATGYGMFLSKKLADLLGLSLTADSKLNAYAVFHLVFPDSDTLYNVTKM